MDGTIYRAYRESKAGNKIELNIIILTFTKGKLSHLHILHSDPTINNVRECVAGVESSNKSLEQF